MIGQLLLVAAAGSAVLGAHPFTTYPASLALLARARPQPLAAGVPGAPRVAFCVCAYNEERVIRAKADNMLAMRDAVPGLGLFVYVDAASDATSAILAEYAGRIDVTVSPVRLGKTAGMNTLVAKAEAAGADILVFSDANVVFAPDAIPRLLERFADPAVGCVCGHLVYVTSQASATAATGSLYWRLEEFIKELETQTGSTMGADGSIFAIRRVLHTPPPPDIIDDMFVSLSILCGGYRVVRAKDAIAYEETTSQSSDEFRRKIRISCQAYNVHRLLRPRLARLDGLNRYKYVSHKLLRWFSIYFFAGAGLLYLAGLASLGAWLLLILSLVAGGACLAGALLAPASPLGKVLDIGTALVATGIGIIRSLRGDRFQVWTPPASARGGGRQPPLNSPV